MSDEYLRAALTLLRVSSLGPVTFRKLIRVFGSPQATLSAPKERLSEVPDLPARVVDGIVAATKDTWADDELKRAQDRNIKLLTWDDPAYPKGLLNIHDAPPVLYVDGELTEFDTLAVAIVGSRSASEYGKKQAETLAAGLARAGFTVVSGLAKGIDTCGHLGALNQPGGRTLAVLGNGLSTVYPAENKKLYEQIVKERRGAAISECPMETGPSKENFPRRNRIIAGLSLGVVVVEAQESSGALITARFAVDMDREVFAVPGPVTHPGMRGPHRLIKQGAKLVEDVGDILAELGSVAAPLVKLPPPDERLRLPKPEKAEPELPLLEKSGEKDPETPDTRPQVADLRAIKLNARERLIFELLTDHEAASVDALIQRSGLKAHEVLSTLMVLEIRRLCKQLPGKRFVKG